MNLAWGVPVVTTTQIAAGTGLIGNLNDAATVYVREGLNLQVSKNNLDNFQRNQTSFIYEERLNLGVARPAALLKVTALP